MIAGCRRGNAGVSVQKIPRFQPSAPGLAPLRSLTLTHRPAFWTQQRRRMSATDNHSSPAGTAPKTGSLSISGRNYWPGIRLSIALLVIAFAYFYRLDRPLLWGDEADTGIGARNIMRYGYPLEYDGRNLSVFQNGAELNRSLVRTRVSWGQFYLGALSDPLRKQYWRLATALCNHRSPGLPSALRDSEIARQMPGYHCHPGPDRTAGRAVSKECEILFDAGSALRGAGLARVGQSQE